MGTRARKRGGGEGTALGAGGRERKRALGNEEQRKGE